MVLLPLPSSCEFVEKRKKSPKTTIIPSSHSQDLVSMHGGVVYSLEQGPGVLGKGGPYLLSMGQSILLLGEDEE